jgi:tetratricopeptide (TPR) repeat protein
MKKSFLKFIGFSIGALFLSSCSNMLYTTLDVLRPAKVAFLPNVNRLLIANNTPTIILENEHNKAQKTVSLPTDSLPIYCLSVLAQELGNNSFFSSVLLEPNSIFPKNNFSEKFSSEMVKKLCENYNCDVILTLDSLKASDVLTEYYLEDVSQYLSTYEIFLKSKWSIYYPSQSKPVSLQFKDTVYWEAQDYSRQRALKQMPNRWDALVDGALYVGKNSVKRFIPYWDKVDRYFFNPGNKLMRQAMDSVYVRNWNSAIELWKKAMNKSDSEKLKGEAANNIAIAYEILGDMDNAIAYADQSLHYFSAASIIDFDTLERISNYYNELIKRKNEIEQLKLQLGE